MNIVKIEIPAIEFKALPNDVQFIRSNQPPKQRHGFIYFPVHKKNLGEPKCGNALGEGHYGVTIPEDELVTPLQIPDKQHW